VSVSRASQSAPTSVIHAAASASGLGRRPVARLAPAALGRDEARVGERGEMLRHRLAADRQGAREIVIAVSAPPPARER